MNNKFFSKVGLGICAIALLAAGCSTAGYKSELTESGSAAISIDVAGLTTFDIARVVVVAAGGIESELRRDNTSGSFLGTILLPAGPTEIVGRAFSSDGKLVGESTPVLVDVQAGFAVAASLRILDLIGGGDVDHGPIIMALTHPLSTLASQQASLEIIAVDPDKDPIDIAWSSDCGDDTFSSPNAAVTQWSKAAQGACVISVTASSKGLVAQQSFSVAVFSETSATGAVNIDGVFVESPSISISVQPPGKFCNVFDGAFNGTCPDSISSPTVAFVGVSVDWHNAEPGTITLEQDCGGVLSVFNPDDHFFLSSNWVPPVNETVCLLTAQAVSPEGVKSKLSAAMLVRAGQPIKPRIFTSMASATGSCQSAFAESDVTCPDINLADGAITINVQMDWNNLAPGTFSFEDDCGGALQVFFQDSFALSGQWLPQVANVDCQLTIKAENPLNGGSAAKKLRFKVL